MGQTFLTHDFERFVKTCHVLSGCAVVSSSAQELKQVKHQGWQFCVWYERLQNQIVDVLQIIIKALNNCFTLHGVNFSSCETCRSSL